jgi:cell wall integrity and stress response component
LGEYTFQASGYCQQQCAGQGLLVMATTDGSTCLCGNELPPASDKVDESKCSEPCDGYDQENCGGKGYFQLYLTGLGTPGEETNSASSTSGNPQSATSAQPSVITKAGQTIVVTASATAGSESSHSGGGSSKVGIAVGVVVGVLAVAAIVGGIILFLKRRRNKAIEEEHRRNAAVNSFVSGAKSETSSNTDQRLDPTAFSFRRESIGSIADERDFSRKILQVIAPSLPHPLSY